MNAEELRALQKPYKDQYRNAPDTALITLRQPPPIQLSA